MPHEEDELLKILVEKDEDNSFYFKFIKDIYSHYFKFKEKLIKNEEELKKWKKEKIKNLKKTSLSKKVKKKKRKEIKSFYKQKTSIKSPLTIFDSSWGNGKTTFFESLKEKLLSSEKKLPIENIEIINLFEHIFKETDVIKEFSKIMYKIIYKQKFCKLGFWILWGCFYLNRNKKFQYSLKLKKWSWLEIIILFPFWILIKALQYIITKIPIKWYINKISKKIKPTILVLDEIERLENWIPEIIKIIQFYSLFSNFIFILPMNKSTINFGNFVQMPGEDPIDKFINLGVYFSYTTSYQTILIDYKFPLDQINIIINILKTPNNTREFLSIRELEKLLDNIHYDEYNWNDDWNKNKYNFGWLFDAKEIWKNNLLRDSIRNLINELIRLEVPDNINKEIINQLKNNNIDDYIIKWLEDFTLENNNILWTNQIFVEQFNKYIYDEIEKNYKKIIGNLYLDEIEKIINELKNDSFKFAYDNEVENLRIIKKLIKDEDKEDSKIKILNWLEEFIIKNREILKLNNIDENNIKNEFYEYICSEKL